MSTAIEYDSIFGNTHCGVPNPFIPHVSEYPTRFHGPVFRYAQQTDAYSPAVLERAVPMVSPASRVPPAVRIPGVNRRAPSPRVAPIISRAIRAVSSRLPTGAPAGFGAVGPLGVEWWWGLGAVGVAALAFVAMRSRPMTPNRRRRMRANRKPGRRDTYVTTFCNFPHDMATGRPIGHECYILPPTALFAERAGDFDTAQFILATRGKGPVVRGRARST